MRHDSPRWPALLFFAALAATGNTGAHQSRTAALDRIVDEVQARYRLPGFAVGVVENGEVVYRRSEGELIAGSGRKIGADSLFKIASNSKSMTTAALARLVDAGKLRWDDPVTKYLPDFRMHEDWVTREMQVRDLLIHNSGLRAGAGDLMLWPEPNTFTRADILHGLRYLKPVHSFRSRYDYDNLLYIVAGEVAAKAGGAPYEDVLKREVFAPLGLSRCQIGAWDRDAVGDVAQPHARRDGRYLPVRQDEARIAASTMDPAGGVRCSLNDMIIWLRAWLTPDRRGADGKPWLSREQREALWRAQMPMNVSPRQRDWANTHFAAYGYGWRLTDADGAFKVSHTGTLMGMYSLVTLLPDRRSGFVVLINGDAGDARSVFDQMLTRQFTAAQAERDRERGVAWYADALAADAQAPVAGRAPDTSRRKAATPAELRARLGVYRDPWFGEVSVCARGQSVRWSARKSPLLTGTIVRAGPRLRIDWDAEEVDTPAWIDFAASDQAATFVMSKVDPDADFSYDFEDLAFTRVGDCG
ncbi:MULTISPECIES: serine hydrolase domain-containing protein [unclassified Lysobacter]|uniref:serine hydrolase domain-containing protein n=1 Tax=unclassified Lysobacter TaxID=2635362 RepID=UPI001BEAF4C9|nr:MULTISPECIES: serine hydrolase domain-containing protein [unclassified Lysobacter]MBT2745940.1 serine hydrolase [Lysobacter sp. ISL-42]MBT2752677.1 serine hydrolase [Lysobacter sp. ISL-50]MBT2777416.1 serine hydrolase [Lysobacter sp. ISL-54]MBT2783607.1 serine hydrolase [Lysobacter sp. ISL-52]